MSNDERHELPGLGDEHAEGTALYLLVEPITKDTDTGSRAAGRSLPPGTPYRVVHAISRWAGGEVRGYLLLAAELHVREPTNPVDWPELDAAVARVFGVPVTRPRPAP